MIFITCNKGSDTNGLQKVCHIFSNIKTNQNIILNNDLNLYNPPLYRFIRKNDEKFRTN